MRIFTFCYICLYSILIPFILGESNIYGIVNLDSKTSGSDEHLLSEDLQKAYKDHLANFAVLRHTSTKKEEIKIRANSSKAVLEMDESQHLIINSNKFYHATNQSEIFNYKINAYIDKGIVPEKYYNGFTSITNTPNVLSCNYNNTIPIIGFSPINKVLHSVVNTKSWNFGLDDNGNIKCFKIGNSFELIIQDPEMPTQSNYTKLFYPITFKNNNGSLLYAVKNNDNNDGTIIDEFHINSGSNCSLNYNTSYPIESKQINQLALSDNYLYIATGDKGLLKTDFYDNIIYSSGNDLRNITDIIINNKTVYAINGGNSLSDEPKGLYIFNISDSTIGTPKLYLEHPYLVKFDYLLDSYNNQYSTYYVGVVVDNHPEEQYPEILIELIANLNLEYSPKINKIFLTQQDIHVTDIVTDIYSFYSYILDRSNNKQLYTLTRGVPNYQDSFSYVRSLEDILQGGFPDQNDHLSVITLSSEVNALLIHERDQMLVAMDLVKFSQTLECVFHKGGKYIEKVTEGHDCSTRVGDTYELNICINDIEFYINVTEEEAKNRAGLWVALVIGIIVVLCIIGGVLYFTFTKKSKPTSKNVEVQQNESQNKKETQEIDHQKGNNEDKDGNELEETNFDNKC